MKLPIFLPLVLLLSACASGMMGLAPPAQADRAAGSTSLNQPVRVGAVTVTPLRVIEDSRCPLDVRCVWAGRVVLTVRIEGNGWDETANLISGETYQTHGQNIALTSVRPARTTQAAVPPEHYLFDFELR